MWLPRPLRKSTWGVALPPKLGPLTAVGRTIKIDTPAEVAQVVEHGTENAGVDSSSLSLGTFLCFRIWMSLEKTKLTTF